MALLTNKLLTNYLTKIIWQIWTDPRKGLQEKRNLERNLIQIETFYEAVPSTLIMT